MPFVTQLPAPGVAHLTEATIRFLETGRLDALQEAIGHRFADPDLLLRALIHSSSKDDGLPSNERMEFLGDSVLGMIVSEYLYATYEQCEEGELSMVKSVVVSSLSLAEIAQEMSLGSYVRLGKGIAQRKPIPSSVLANAFEAMLAALYMDGGLPVVKRFILRHLVPRIEAVLSEQYERNYKSLLQQHTQKSLGVIPNYRVVAESGPDHEKRFEVMVQFSDRTFGPGSGTTKKDAEQQAARAALLALGAIPAETSAPTCEPGESIDQGNRRSE